MATFILTTINRLFAIYRRDVINEVDAKIKALKYPKGFSCRPVLIHANGVQDAVMESGFFSEIIDFSLFLENEEINAKRK
jgi:hypothetical protein